MDGLPDHHWTPRRRCEEMGCTHKRCTLNMGQRWSHDSVSPYGLLLTTVDGRFDARGTPGRPREDNEEGRDKRPLATPSLNVALRVQRAPRPPTGTGGGPSAQRPETTQTKAT